MRARYAEGGPEAAYELYWVISERVARESLERWPADEPSWGELTAQATAFGYRPAQWMVRNPGYYPDGSAEKDIIKLLSAYRTSAEAGDPMGAFYLAQAFGSAVEKSGAACNFATAEYWLIEAGARAWPGQLERPFLNAQLALANLYSGLTPDTGLMLPAHGPATFRWLREAVGRGGEIAANASLLLRFHQLFATSWGSRVDIAAKLADVPPEVPPIPAATLAGWTTAAIEGDNEAALKLDAAYSTGRGVRQDDLKAVEMLRAVAEGEGDASVEVYRALAEHHKTGFGAAIDDTQRLHWLQGAADLGDASAWMEIGGLYLKKDDKPGAVTPDPTAALHAFEQALALGDADAAREVARRYSIGDGLDKDVAQARGWLQRGADAGDPYAMLELAKSFVSWSDPYEQWDYASAERWFLQAAAGGAKGAYAGLAQAYVGTGVPYAKRDHAKAARWYHKAVESGDRSAREKLALELSYTGEKEAARELFLELAEEGNATGQIQTARALDWNQQRAQAAEWYRKIAAREGGNADWKKEADLFLKEYEEEQSAPPGSLLALRGLAKDGDGDARVRYAQMIAPTDRHGAMRWLRLAANDQHAVATAMFYLEMKKENPDFAKTWLAESVEAGNAQAMLISGLETGATDRAAGWALMQRAVAAGNLEAKYRVGLMMYQGNAAPQDIPGGVRLLTEAADGGLPAAQFDLGRALVGGSPGITVDPRRGIAYLEKAAAQNVAQACGMLGEINERGIGGEPDRRAAFNWYQRAEQLGLAAAGPAAQRVEQQMRAGRTK